MKLRLLTISAIAIFALLIPFTANGQTRTYTAAHLDYVLVLPSARWHVVNVPGVAHDSTQFRYDNHGTVHLRIRRELAPENASVADVIERQQTLDRSSLRGYVKEKVEPIAGRLNGARYAYEYVTEGKLTARVIYYLKANDRIVYRLEFGGEPELLRSISNQTDSIAKNFRLK
jgi:hypothetical protein